MKSIKYLFRIGNGPSSSHTIGPCRVCQYIKTHYPNAIKADVTLFGSLALTGRGHRTDKVIIDTLKPIESTITFDINTPVDHPNTMKVVIYNKDGTFDSLIAKSIGGGSIRINDETTAPQPEIYPEKNFDEIKAVCFANKWSLLDYVYIREGKEIKEYLGTVFDTMMDEIDRGLKGVGYLPGKLHIRRRAKDFLIPVREDESETSYTFRLLNAYAFACAEENASGGIVVTAPTCGSCGVLPAVLKFYKDKYSKTREECIDALAIAGIIGNVIKYNASLAGAEAGCQAEIGSACSMTAAAYGYLKKFNLTQIECAAEVAMEHSLGQTCDPVGGYVIIPCIERNAMAAVRAVAASRLAEYSNSTAAVSFDTVVQTMYRTGKDMKKAYRETSLGGLAKQLK